MVRVKVVRHQTDEEPGASASEDLAQLMVDRNARMLASLESYARQHDQVLFEDAWVSREEAARLYSKTRFKQIVLIVELLLLAGGTGAAAWMAWALAGALAGQS